MHKRYLWIFTSAALLIAAALLLRPNYKDVFALSEFAGISAFDGDVWYRDLGGRSKPEIQDLDLFYHDIGPSIGHARQADIIILGPSFTLYGLDPDELRRFGERHGLKIFNMSFFGVRSGEFSRRIIKRWSLHPKLWIINLDDNFDHFFSTVLTMQWIGVPKPFPIPPTEYGRLRGWGVVAQRNARWRLEDAMLPAKPDGSVYRRHDDGGVYLGNNPRFDADNGKIVVTRDQNCHAQPGTIDVGRNYLASIGGEAVLTLVPSSTWCPLQVRELGKALGKEVIVPPDAAYSTVDGGGHLDHKGALAFTDYFLHELEQSQAFKKVGFSAGH